MSYISSKDISIYPTAYRQYGTTVYNPEAKLNTEYNVTNQVSQILGDGHKCFVVSYANNVLRLCIKGYAIEIRQASEYLKGSSSIYASLVLDNRSSGDYKNLIELAQSVTEGYDLDSSSSSDTSEFLALVLGDSGDLLIWNGSEVPEASFLKFNLSDIDGYELSNTHEKLQDTLSDLFDTKVDKVESPVNNEVVKFNSTTGGIKKTANKPVTIDDNGNVTINSTGTFSNALLVRGDIQTETSIKLHHTFNTHNDETDYISPSKKENASVRIVCNRLPKSDGRLVNIAITNFDTQNESEEPLTSNYLILGNGNSQIKKSTLSFASNTLKNDSNNNIEFDSTNSVVINNDLTVKDVINAQNNIILSPGRNLILSTADSQTGRPASNIEISYRSLLKFKHYNGKYVSIQYNGVSPSSDIDVFVPNKSGELAIASDVVDVSNRVTALEGKHIYEHNIVISYIISQTNVDKINMSVKFLCDAAGTFVSLDYFNTYLKNSKGITDNMPYYNATGFYFPANGTALPIIGVYAGTSYPQAVYIKSNGTTDTVNINNISASVSIYDKVITLL